MFDPLFLFFVVTLVIAFQGLTFVAVCFTFSVSLLFGSTKDSFLSNWSDFEGISPWFPLLFLPKLFSNFYFGRTFMFPVALVFAGFRYTPKTKTRIIFLLTCMYGSLGVLSAFHPSFISPVMGNLETGG